MKATEFCYWLQGLFEMAEPVALTEKQTQLVKAHLAMVFKHEIDPSYGSPEVQAALTALHESGKVGRPPRPAQPPVAHDHIHPGDVLLRC